MKNTLTLVFALICINTFAQTDDWFWSYRKSTGQDTIFYTTANLYADGKVQIRSGSSVSLNGFRSIPANATTRVSYSDYSIGGGLYLNYLTSKKNNITQLTNFYGRGTVFSLDISRAKALTTLGITTCRLSSLDLSKNKMLESISIGNEAATYTSLNLNENNLLRNVSIYNHVDADGYGYALNTIYLENSPILESINCSFNYFLNQIHLGLPNYNLSYFYGFESAFTQTSVDYILKWLVDGNRNGGTVNLCGQRNAIPSTLGMTYVSELTNRGWSVCVNRSYSNPTVQTNPATSIFINYATLNGSVINEGSSSVNERGFYYSTSPDPKNSGTKVTSGSGSGQFSYIVTNLSANTKYYFCAYALSNDGYGYGDDLDFTTPVQEQTVPELITTLPSNIGTTSATSGGTITFDGNYPITAKGVQWSLDSNFSTITGSTNEGTGVSSFTSSMTGLQSNTAYYVRSFATNRKDVGGFYVYATGYGQTEMFMTASSSACILPTISTNGINNITETSVIGGGNVTSDGECEVTMKGSCWSTLMNPTTSDPHTTDGSGIGVFSSYISPLYSGTQYVTRAYAINSSGTSYGSNVFFTTATPSIAQGYGYLYNWYAAMGDINGDGISETSIANTGWHVATKAEYETLINHVGISTAGNSLKLNGTTLWSASNTGTNLSLFSATGGGYRVPSGEFYDLQNRATIWTSTGYDSTNAWFLGLIVDSPTASLVTSDKSYGHAIRLIRDSTPLVDGQYGWYIGNDGQAYLTFCIGTQEWIISDLKESKFRNGTVIPEVQSGWYYLNYAAKCYYVP